MKRHLFVSLLSGSLFFLSSCGPTAPTFPTSISLGSPLIQASVALQGNIANAAQVLIETDSYAVTNAGVTLTASGLTMPLTFASSNGAGGYYYGYYYSITGWTYTANQPYTMTVKYGGNTYKGSIKTVGNVAFNAGGSALTIVWAGGGTQNTVQALQTDSPYNSYTFGPNLTSPYVLQNSSLGGYTGGNYSVQANLINLKTSAFDGGAYIGSFFTASDQEQTTH